MSQVTTSRWPYLTLTVGLALSGCGQGTGSVEPLTSLPRDLTVAEIRVIEGSNAFAFGLLREVVAASDTPNVFLSPLSASMALGMTMNGAEGETWSQMRDALGFDGMTEEQVNRAYRDLTTLLLGLDHRVRLGIANSIWSDRTVSLLPAFVDRVRAHFGAEVRMVDFGDPGTKDEINRWVSGATNGRIDRMLESVPNDVLMYLINAVYFQGDWRSQFERSRTAPAAFTRDDGAVRQVPMMAGKVGYRAILGHGPNSITAVELPYARNAFAAVAVLPPAGVAARDFVADLDVATWASWMAELDEQASREDTGLEGIMVRLPKLEIEWEDSLVAPLRRLGMRDAFDPNLADFSRMTGGRDLFVTEAFQKTFLKVDEAGTEAAAATAIAMRPTSAPPSATFDRPFLFAIRERFSGTILFLGVIGDPAG